MHIFRVKSRDEFVLGKGFYIVDKNGQGASAIDLIEEAGRAINSVEELRDDNPHRYCDFPSTEIERFVGGQEMPYADRNVQQIARRRLSPAARSEARAWVAVMRGLFKLAIKEMEACYLKFDKIGGFSTIQGNKRKHLSQEKYADVEKRKDKMLKELDEGVIRSLIWAEDTCYDQYVKQTKRWKLPIQNKKFRMKVAAMAVANLLHNSRRRTFAATVERRSSNFNMVIQIAGCLPAFGSGKPVEYSTTSKWKVPVV